MEPEPEPVDLSALDPRRDDAHWERSVSRVAARAIELRRLRRAVVRRGGIALVLAAAAALALWLMPARPQPRSPADILDWATRDVSPDEVLGLGGGHAQ